MKYSECDSWKDSGIHLHLAGTSHIGIGHKFIKEVIPKILLYCNLSISYSNLVILCIWKQNKTVRENLTKEEEIISTFDAA